MKQHLSPTALEILAREISTDDDFWKSRESLTRIREYARMCLVGPWALLGGVMLRAIADIPPSVTIPAIVGGQASLNLFVGFVGRSGHGKGTSDAAARRCWPTTVSELPIGTGEGLAATFYRDPNDQEAAANTPESVIFTASEVDTLNVLGGRSGATLYPELRKLAMGETLGAQNASKEHRRVVQPHTYRACLSVGIQPERAGTLIDDAGGGTPQRFVWLPVIDPDAPDIPPADVAPLEPADCCWPAGTIHVPRHIWTEVRSHRRRVLRGDSTVNPLDGHRYLTRIKVSAALAVIDKRKNIDDDDWRLAGYVMDVSDSTRDAITAAIERERKRAVADTARTNALRVILTSDAEVRHVADKVLGRLGPEPVPASELRRAVTPRLREHFEPAVELLVEASEIQVADLPNGRHIRRTPG